MVDRKEKFLPSQTYTAKRSVGGPSAWPAETWGSPLTAGEGVYKDHNKKEKLEMRRLNGPGMNLHISNMLSEWWSNDG